MAEAQLSERSAETDIEREEIAEENEDEMREMGCVLEQDASGKGVDDAGGMGADQGWTEGRWSRGKSIETWIQVARSMQEVKMEMRRLVVQARQRARDGNEALRDP